MDNIDDIDLPDNDMVLINTGKEAQHIERLQKEVNKQKLV